MCIHYREIESNRVDYKEDYEMHSMGLFVRNANILINSIIRAIYVKLQPY